MRGIGGVSLTNLRVTVGTPAEGSVTFVIESSNEVIHTGTVTSDAPVVVDIPEELQVIESNFANRGKGIHVYSTGDELIYVLGENFLTFLNHGVFLAYPCLTLENTEEYEYRAITNDVESQLFSEILLVGCENNTEITITPTQTISLPQNAQMTSTAVTIEPDTTYDLTLNQMQTLLVLSTSDLSGTKITSNKPLTVLSGNECANVPLSGSGCEPFAVQVPPIATWGNTFLLAPFAGRDGPSVYKAVSSKNDTSFLARCGDASPFTPSASVFVLNSEVYCYFEATNPIFVVQFSFGASIDGRGDPSMSIVSPIDQYINATEFVTLSTSDFASHYISITVAAEHYNPSSIVLDGNTIDCDWQPIANRSNSTVGYGCSKAISSGSNVPAKHSVSHSDDGGLLSVLVYGFNIFPAQGYAYLTGQALSVTEGKALHYYNQLLHIY